MKTLSKGLWFFCLFVLWMLVVLPKTAEAYIDPGTGGYIIQVLIAAFLAGGYAIRVFWKKIKTFFVSLLGKNKKTDI